MFDRQYSFALLTVNSASKDTTKARGLHNSGSGGTNGSQTHAINSPHSTFSSKHHNGSIKGIQKSWVNEIVIASGREDGFRAADSETGITSPKHPVHLLNSPLS
jgi:hypothetical protein